MTNTDARVAIGATATTPRLSASAKIGTNVHDLLWRRGIRQSRAAHHIGVTSSVLSKKLRGKSTWSDAQIEAVAELLSVTPGRLFEEPTGQYVARNHSGGTHRGRKTARGRHLAPVRFGTKCPPIR